MNTIRDKMKMPFWCRAYPLSLALSVLAVIGGPWWLVRLSLGLTVDGQLAASAPLWLVWAWTILVTIGGGLLLVSIPLEWRRTQASGLILAVSTLFLVALASFMNENWALFGLLAALVVGMSIHLRTVLSALRASARVVNGEIPGRETAGDDHL